MHRINVAGAFDADRGRIGPVRDIDLLWQFYFQHSAEMLKLGASLKEQVLDVVENVRVRQAFGDLLAQDLTRLRNFRRAVWRK